MSKFTTELRYICENYSGLTESKGYNDVESIIAECADWIFGDFPIYDEEYRDILERKIIRHYYTREISEETVGLWRLRVNDKMNIIMPYYNQLYKSTLLEFNPFYDVDLTRDYKRKDDGSEGKIENEAFDETGSKNIGEISTVTSIEKGSNKIGENNIENEAVKERNSGENNTNYDEVYNENDERKAIENNGEIETRNSKTNKEANETETRNLRNHREGEETETRNLANHREGEENETRNLAGSKIKSGSETDSIDKWDLYSDTPQGGVVGIVNAGAESVGNNAYLTNARHITDAGTKTFNNVTENETNSGTVGRVSEEDGTDTGTITKVSEEDGTDTGTVARETEEDVNESNSASRQGNYNGSSEGKNSGSKKSSNNEEFNKNNDISRSKTSGKMTSGENETNKTDQNNRSATEGTKLDRSSQRVGQSVISNMSEYIEHVIGKQGGHSYSKMLLEFRETMLNIDAMIIKELETLFFGLWE